MEVVYICIGIGLIVFTIMLTVAIYLLKNEKSIKKNGIKTDAKVLGYVNQTIKQLRVSGRSRILRIKEIVIKRAILEFVDEQGKKHIVLRRAQDSSQFKVGEVGNSINICYRENDVDNIMKKIDAKYEDYYNMDIVKDEEGIEHKLTDDSNRFDILCLNNRKNNTL